jgi:hypothetical protein
MAARGRRSYTAPVTLVSDYDALPVNSCGVLPNGLQLWKWIARDCYVGTREILVHAGVAQADWFPAAAAPRRRVFNVQTAAGRIKLVARTGCEWEIQLPVDAAERKRRQQELDRQLKAHRAAEVREDELLESQEDAALRQSITLAPAVEPLSLSAHELHHLRLLRTVGRRTRDSILDFTERLLLADARYGELALRQGPRLTLVVDNTRSG